MMSSLRCSLSYVIGFSPLGTSDHHPTLKKPVENIPTQQVPYQVREVQAGTSYRHEQVTGMQETNNHGSLNRLWTGLCAYFQGREKRFHSRSMTYQFLKICSKVGTERPR